MDAPAGVNKKWLFKNNNKVPTCCLGIKEMEDLHGIRHMVVDRILYLVQKFDWLIKRRKSGE